MRFLRVLLVALSVLTLIGSTALADTAPDTSTSTTESSTESSTPPSTDSSTESELTEPVDTGGDTGEEAEVDEDPTVEDLMYSELKGVVSAITPAEGDSPATVTVTVDGQTITFTAEQLGLTPEALALVTVGAEFKYENKEGKLELKITSEIGTVKLERNEDGSLELKLEEGSPGKGHEISEEKKARAEEHKGAARQKAEEARQNSKSPGKGKGHR